MAPELPAGVVTIPAAKITAEVELPAAVIIPAAVAKIIPAAETTPATGNRLNRIADKTGGDNHRPFAS